MIAVMTLRSSSAASFYAFSCIQAVRLAISLQSWIETMAPYVKGLDPYHLLTIGEEGFYGTNDLTRANAANPQYTNS